MLRIYSYSDLWKNWLYDRLHKYDYLVENSNLPPADKVRLMEIKKKVQNMQKLTHQEELEMRSLVEKAQL